LYIGSDPTISATSASYSQTLLHWNLEAWCGLVGLGWVGFGLVWFGAVQLTTRV